MALASIAVVNAVGARADMRVWRAMQKAAREAEYRAAAQARKTQAIEQAGKKGKGADSKMQSR